MLDIQAKIKTIKGQRIQLHQFTPDCISDEYLCWLNDQQLMRFSRQSRITHTHESCLQYLSSFEGTNNFFWSVRHGADLQIGTMTAYVDSSSLVADIGIIIAHQSVRGKEFGAEAWGLAMWFLFDQLGMRKISGGTLAPHTSMIRIFERWGMNREGTLRQHELLQGTVYDVFRYGISKEEWLALPDRPLATMVP